MVLTPVWEQLATDQTDPWQFVSRQVFSLISVVQQRLLFSVALVVSG